MRTTLSAERITRGELSGAWIVSAWIGESYRGEETFLYYTKREATARAREIIKEEGGLGICLLYTSDAADD